MLRTSPLKQHNGFGPFSQHPLPSHSKLKPFTIIHSLFCGQEFGPHEFEVKLMTKTVVPPISPCNHVLQILTDKIDMIYKKM